MLLAEPVVVGVGLQVATATTLLVLETAAGSRRSASSAGCPTMSAKSAKTKSASTATMSNLLAAITSVM